MLSFAKGWCRKLFGSLPGFLRGSISMLVLTVNTLFWSSLLLALALLKLLIPIAGWRLVCSRILNQMAQNWIGGNNLGLDFTKEMDWDVEGLDGLRPDSWYLVVANHQSWVDIAVLQRIFHRRIPFLKFFLKKELIWIPVMGVVWWALDYPFMDRKSAALKDLNTTRKACEKFKQIPVSIMNFLEGTRFTAKKRQEQGSPYTHLLKPRSGGIALVLGTMGRQIRSILNVTIAYPGGVPGMWDFLCSTISRVTVRVEQIPVRERLLGDYFSDREYRRTFNQWLNDLWREKDDLMGTLLVSKDRGA